METATQSLALYFYYAKASHAQPHDIPLRSDTQALRLIARIPLIQRRKKCCSRKENAPPRSGILLSMHVVLKTRHVNPNIHVRRFIVHVRSPNLSTTRPQLLPLRRATTYYGLAPHTTTRLYPTPIVVCTPPHISRTKEQRHPRETLPRAAN